jgi:hypothetical protein
VVFNEPPVVGVSMMRKQVVTNLAMKDIEDLGSGILVKFQDSKN